MIVDSAAGAPGGSQADAEEASLVAALRAGDEGAFRELVSRYHPSLVRVARSIVDSHAVAEEVAQDTCWPSSGESTGSSPARR